MSTRPHQFKIILCRTGSSWVFKPARLISTETNPKPGGDHEEGVRLDCWQARL